MYYEEERIQMFEVPASLQDLISMLQELGLNSHEARVLLYIMIHKNRSASTISEDLGINRTEIYKYISNLMKKGLVFATSERPQRYHALSLEGAIGCLIESKKKMLEHISLKQPEFCSILNNLAQEEAGKDTIDDPESFQLIVGYNPVFSRLKEMFASCKDEIKILATETWLISLYNEGLIDSLVQLTNNGIRARMKTSCGKTLEYLRAVDDDNNGNGNIDGNIILSTTEDATQLNFAIVDNKEIILMFGSRKNIRAFYSNIGALVISFNNIFDNAI